MVGPDPIPAESGLASRNLGGFTLRAKIGSGGFGDVYLAEQPELHREAIVKILRAEIRDDRNVQRFLREAQLASRLDHPYAAHIYKFGAESDGVFWIAMERVRGASLRAVIEAQGPMALDRFVPLLEKICEVVHTAHEQGIVHRDLKPDNVMVISRAGRLLPKLLDFGIARASGDAPESLAAALDNTLDRPPDHAQTQRGDVLGSPSYMAPELWINAHDVGPPADQYALAALAYEALTGKLAFTGATVFAVARAHAKGNRAPLGPEFPVELERVIKRALSRKPEDRYGNVLELAQAFRAASGLGTERDLPQLDDELRTRLLTAAPQPIADAVAAYDAAKNPHQAREALRGIVRIACWYIGLLALASRSRVGSGGGTESERARRLLRDLRRQGLPPAGWAALATQLTEPFVRLPDTHPLPELVLLLHGAGADTFAAALEGSLFESLADSSDEAAAQANARELPIVGAVLRAIGELLAYRLVVPRGTWGESWMGIRGVSRSRVVLRRTLPEGKPVILDAEGGPLLALWPLVQIVVPLPGQPEQMFLLAGPGRRGAKLVSTPHDFEHTDDQLWDWFRDNLFDPEGGEHSPERDHAPFRGLVSYSTSDGGWFFGRERETESLVNRLKLEAFVAVIGPSGVGKSSFVHAGVAPALADWKVVSTRPGRGPLAQLGAQLANAGLDVGTLTIGEVEDAATHLHALAAEHRGLLIVVDQFEELITLGCAREERDGFIHLLLAITRAPTSPIRVVITLRDDFLIRAEQLPGLASVLGRGLQLLGPLGTEALERVLTESARRAGYEFEDPEVPARMVREVEGAPAAVALISFTASRLWEFRDRQFHQLPSKAYEAIGGVGGALARHADEVVDALPAAERALVRKAFRQLVTYEGTRAVLERQEIVELLGGGTDVERLVEQLVDARLLSSADTECGPTIEIVHEVLLAAWPRLSEWRREDVEGSRLHEQLRAAAKQWQDRGRPRGLLWRGDALAEYQLWRKRHADNLTPAEAAFGAASVADGNRNRRIRRAIVTVTIAITALFIAILVRANRAEQQSRRETETLLRDASFEQGRLLGLDGNKLAALPHLLDAYRMGDTQEANRLLIEEASRGLRASVLTLEGHHDKLSRVAYSPDGNRIATAGVDQTSRLWDARTGAVITTSHIARASSRSRSRATARCSRARPRSRPSSSRRRQDAPCARCRWVARASDFRAMARAC